MAELHTSPATTRTTSSRISGKEAKAAAPTYAAVRCPGRLLHLMIHVVYVIAGNLPGAPPPAHYHAAERKFAETYRANPAGAEHELVLVNSNGGLTEEVAGFFDGIDFSIIDYNGTGWDIGAYQHVAGQLAPTTWLMCFSSLTWLWRPGWLASFVAAREAHGDALYGSTASYENGPHIRSTGFMARAEHLRQYAPVVTSKAECMAFESGASSLTARFIQAGRGTYLVTPDGVYDHQHFRDAPNGFRLGDQSNVWVQDKNTAIYERASSEKRAWLGGLADGQA